MPVVLISTCDLGSLRTSRLQHHIMRKREQTSAESLARPSNPHCDRECLHETQQFRAEELLQPTPSTKSQQPQQKERGSSLISSFVVVAVAVVFLVEKYSQVPKQSNRSDNYPHASRAHIWCDSISGARVVLLVLLA